ncbi:MAG TPA: hypothetical protein VNJ01_10650 [Bacteriovoracaceae bacterium]|nr:hypothetical protein [Bacteriovoracaceae bacterium]
MGERSINDGCILDYQVKLLAEKYQSVCDHRDPRLFTEFLVLGYRQTTLSSVGAEFTELAVYAKVCLGMIITLYDDLADNPRLSRPQLLKELYRLNIGEHPVLRETGPGDFPLIELAQHLFGELNRALSRLPRQEKFQNLLAFDIRHVYLANQYAELMTLQPAIRNLTESKLLGPYNMGMVAAGTIDLMASPCFDGSETGRLREALILGQRIGRIGNLISTFQRELDEGDLTSELMLHPSGVGEAKQQLLLELRARLSSLHSASAWARSVDLKSYADGLSGLFNLHQKMEGII